MRFEGDLQRGWEESKGRWERIFHAGDSPYGVHVSMSYLFKRGRTIDDSRREVWYFLSRLSKNWKLLLEGGRRKKEKLSKFVKD